MKGRIFSTFTLWAVVALTAIFLKAEGAVLLAAAAALLMQYELYSILSEMGQKPFRFAGLVLGLVVSLTPFLGDAALPACYGVITSSIVLLGIAAILDRSCGSIVNALGSTLLGLLLGPCTLLFVSLTIYHFGPLCEGLLLALWVVMATKFTDMGALLTGMAIGKHKMAPTLSPKKTWEGAFGGTALCVLSSAVFAHYCAPWLPAAFTPITAAIISLPIAVASIFADLLESAFKRESGIKDSGRLLPGIGGVFDLTDSFMLSAPLAYYMLVFVLG